MNSLLLSSGILIRIKLLSQRLAKLCHAEVIKEKRAAKKLILMAKEKRRENIKKPEHKENNKKTKRCCPRQLENIHKSQLVNASVEHWRNRLAAHTHTIKQLRAESGLRGSRERERARSKTQRRVNGDCSKNARHKRRQITTKRRKQRAQRTRQKQNARSK